MHTSKFTYIPVKVGEPMIVQIDQDDEVYNVTIGGAYLGNMVRDEDAPYGWEITDDWPLLIEEIPELSMAIKEQEAIFNLPYALKDLYAENLVGWDWNEDDSLKLIAHPDVEIQEFANTIRDQIYDVVLFDKDLIIYLGKEGSGEVEEIHINC